MTIKQCPPLTVIGVSARTSNAREMMGQGEIGRLWSSFHTVTPQIPHQIGDETVALYTDYENDADGEYTFVLGKKVSASDSIPQGFVARAVPAGRYEVFIYGPCPDCKSAGECMLEKTACIYPASS